MAHIPTILTFLACSTQGAGGYDLKFCTLLGGGKWERIQAVFVDIEGYIYVAGSTKSADFPTTPGAYDTTGSGNNSNDGFVAKIDPQGKSLIWSTYLHGSSRDDVYGLLADSFGFVYAVGWTGSSDFPTTPGALDRTHNGDMDVFLAKLSRDGASLLFSTFLGGSGKDQCRGGMELGGDGAVYLSGYTDSTNFPTTSGAIQRTFQGGYGDAFVVKLSAGGSQLLYSTYLGSEGPDHAFPGLRLHSDGSIIVTGVAGAADFPTTPGAYQEKFAGTPISGVWHGDAFVARLSPGADHQYTLRYSTFLGGSGKEVSTAQHGIALDGEGNAVIAITSHSTDFPTTPGAYQSTLKGNNNLCIARLSLDGSTLLGSTYLGGSPDNGYEPSGLAVDQNGNILVTGSIFGNITNHPVTDNAFRRTSGGEGECFFSVLSLDLSKLRYSTYFGGDGNDRIRDLALDSSGDLIFAGDTYSSNLPITPGAIQKDQAGGGDSYIARFHPASQVYFQRGDANEDGFLDIADAVSVLAYLFLGNPGNLECAKSKDSDDRGSIDLSDVLYLLAYLFLNGPAPVDPFPDCGPDPTEDDLSCPSYLACEAVIR